VRFAGADVSRRLLDAVALAADPSADPPSRHAAVLEIEAAGALPMLWAAVRRGGRLEIAPGRGRRGLAVTRGSPSDTPSAPEECAEVRVTGPGLAPDRAREWLHAVGRFVAVPVTVDGRPLGGRFPGGLYSQRVTGPAPGEVCLAAFGDVPELWLLRHGLVSARATVPGHPAFHAALEMSGLVGPTAAPAALREAVTPLLPGVVESAAELVRRLAAGASDLEDGVRRRVAVLLMEWAATGIGRQRALTIPILRRGDGTLVSLAQVAEVAGERGGRVESADVGAASGRDGGVLVLDSGERAALVRLLPVTLSGPAAAPRPREASVRTSVRRWARTIRAAAARLLRRPLPSVELSEAERRFLDEIGRAWSDGPRVELVAGRGGALPAVALHGRVWLPRDCEDVAAAVAAVARDPGWVYPAVVALVDTAVPPPTLRERWLTGGPTSRDAPCG